MGVRGLTTFIANRSDAYLRKYKLHDTYLVIDGNSLAANLYQTNRTRNDCFGGDYDKYEKTICKFFDILLQCNITPLIILDGAYEKKKLRTVFERLRNKVKTFEKINSTNQTYHKVFPLFVRELFVEVVLRLGIKVIRCDFEADYELACLARTLNCPVLSYDSDFFVYDVLYIPYVTLELVPHQLTNGFYLPCQLYEMEYFLKAYGGLNKSVVPLLAVLLGNDYINKNVFKDFYASLKLTKRKRLQNAAQRSISSVIKWLQNETYDSAIIKVLSKLPENKKQKAARSIKLVVEGYMCKKSDLLKDLDLNISTNKEVDFSIDTEKLLDQSKDIDALELDLQNSVLEDEDEETDDENSNNSDSDEDFTDLESDVEEEDDSCDVIPSWFKANFRKCLYPPAFMDILARNIYFCTPQLENYSNICSHKICVKIISAFNKILRYEHEQPLVYVARHQVSHLKKYETPACVVNLPTLHTLKDTSKEEAYAYIISILELDDTLMNVLADVPEHWQLYMLAIIYWIKNATPNASYSHVYSVVLCMIVMNEIRPRLNSHKHVAKFLLKYKHRLKVEDSPGISKSALLSSIKKEECIRCYTDLAKYFDMEPKMRQCAKSYDRSILDCFAQFQSSLLHIKYLNVLFTKPFSNCIVTEFYNGTFLYNMCANLEKRTNIDAYIDSLLRPFPAILKCFKTIISTLTTVISGNVVTVETKRRKRKRKRSAKLSVSSDDVHKSEDVKNEECDAVIDENNKFSLLNFV
ncbi:hypothetical protein RN001_008279 [Aquatica leii]|uniref:Asteroid domain-containing protein n=1 Tax=Aquatica leii TaxID=1421715 RepID=A0AAN7PAJ5_9COLE|nr:hypothetical protein RN001_008279 [Aquatica leii]